MNYQLNFVTAIFCSLLIFALAGVIGEQWWWLVGIVSIIVLMGFRSWLVEISKKDEFLFFISILFLTIFTTLFLYIDHLNK